MTAQERFEACASEDRVAVPNGRSGVGQEPGDGIEHLVVGRPRVAEEYVRLNEALRQRPGSPVRLVQVQGERSYRYVLVHEEVHA